MVIIKLLWHVGVNHNSRGKLLSWMFNYYEEEITNIAVRIEGGGAGL